MHIEFHQYCHVVLAGFQCSSISFSLSLYYRSVWMANIPQLFHWDVSRPGHLTASSLHGTSYMDRLRLNHLTTKYQVTKIGSPPFHQLVHYSPLLLKA
jgi:hypothetical protein